MLAIGYRLGGRLSEIDLELGNLKEDNKKLDIKVDNLGSKVDVLDKRVLTLEVETKNLVNSVNEVKTRLYRVKTRLDKIDDRINKSSDKYMLFFINKVLDALKIERMKISIKTIECIF
ncbi:hypothetical protein [Borreliella bavariensis]|uniref:hypothetical protein n=1 Tax=Borreliella bavariensis TaxID=664662 RepID=UPI00165E3EBF|nr:hypothetical protein [Borreliella bavariensis]WLN24792.1 hypothetical protein IDK87_06105 [Borreliella bavariensis]